MIVKTKFPLGTTVVTPGVLEGIPKHELFDAMRRHEQGDWGEVPEEDVQLNNEALLNGHRVLSAYTSEAGIRFWIITEADRSVTTVLLPDEY